MSTSCGSDLVYIGITGDTFATCELPISLDGNHRINHESTAVSFGAYLFGFGNYETYATTAGYRLTRINEVGEHNKYRDRNDTHR